MGYYCIDSHKLEPLRNNKLNSIYVEIHPKAPARDVELKERLTRKEKIPNNVPCIILRVF